MSHVTKTYVQNFTYKYSIIVHFTRHLILNQYANKIFLNKNKFRRSLLI